MLFENTTFTNSNLQHNPQGRDFLPKGKIKRQKMVPPKGQISVDTWRTILQGIDEVELICKMAEECLNVDAKDVYRDTDLYHKIVSWRALLCSSKMLDTYQLKGEVRNIYQETLSDDLVGLTENTAEIIYEFFELKLQQKNKSKSSTYSLWQRQTLILIVMTTILMIIYNFKHITRTKKTCTFS